MPKRHRRGGVKQQHSIIPGIRKRLQRIAACPHVQAVTPGRISPAIGSQQPVIVFQYFQETGMKLSGKIPGAVQEIFVVSSAKEAALNWLTAAGLVTLEENRPGKAYSRGRKAKPLEKNRERLVPEASPDTIQQHVSSLSASDLPLAVPIGDRLNGQLHRLRDSIVKQTEEKKQPKATEKRSRVQPSAPSKPATMEAWLEAADQQDADFWRKIKSAKDQ